MSRPYHAKSLRNLMRLFTKKSCCHQGFFAVKRRAVFILGAKWKALVRGWRRDCVVGGMETRFQWRKAHSRTAKCEAFHFAPRLFFRFLFLIPFTIRQQCTIYPPVIFHWTLEQLEGETGRVGWIFWKNIVGEMLAYLEYFNEFWKNIILEYELMVFWGMLSLKIGFLYIWYNQLYKAYLLF